MLFFSFFSCFLSVFFFFQGGVGVEVNVSVAADSTGPTSSHSLPFNDLHPMLVQLEEERPGVRTQGAVDLAQFLLD